MASSVNGAFDEFMKNFVRLDPDRTDVAKRSKNNLISEIMSFPDDGEFLTIHPDKSIDYGSFSRKTKIRELDDIDIMIILNAEGNVRYPISNGFEIQVSSYSAKQKKLCYDGTNTLNSIKVVNKFVNYLSKVSSYQSAEIKRNQEAATLNLKSYEWVFDIVPCFITAPDNLGQTFFLIPDGKGNWKPTDPRIDKSRTTRINQGQAVSVLDVIRIMKYWTKRPTMPTMKSYLLENMILNYYDTAGVSSTQWIDVELPKMFSLIYNGIHQPLYDPKGYQGDINHLDYAERNLIQERARVDYNKAIEARQLETEGKQKESIRKWAEIFGPNFPSYTT